MYFAQDGARTTVAKVYCICSFEYPNILQYLRHEISWQNLTFRPGQINTMVYGFWGLKSLWVGDFFYFYKKLICP